MLSRCIYSLQDETTASFKQAEHIIPKAIGGIYTLPKGMVSDAVNHEFSKFEEHVIHNFPMISSSRELFGPRGRRKHTRMPGVTLMTATDGNHPELGYILEGKPYSIHQVIAYLDKYDNFNGRFKVTLPENARYNDESKTNIKILARNLLSLPRYFRLIQTDNEAMINQFIVGYEKEQLYLGFYSRFTKENAISKGEILLNLLDKILHDDMQPKKSSGTVHSKHHVTLYKTYTIILSSVYRFCAKIAFNAFARILMDDRIYTTEYDAIRHAILTGEDIEDFVHLILDENHKKKMLTVSKWLNLGKQCHYIQFFRMKDCLKANVSFYGGSLMVRVDIGRITKPMDVFDASGYICDWENGKEGLLSDFLHNWVEQSEIDALAGKDEPAQVLLLARREGRARSKGKVCGDTEGF